MVDRNTNANLQELRSRLTDQVAMLMIVLGSVSALILLIQQPFPATRFTLSFSLVSIGMLTKIFKENHARLSRAILTWGATAVLLLAMWLIHDIWVPFMALPLILVGSLLVPISKYVSSVLSLALAGVLSYQGARGYPLTGLVATYICTGALSWLAVRTLYTALDWAWTMQKRSDDLLEVARDRQGELARSLKSLNITLSILNRTREELRSALKQAEEARAMKEQFAANVSHELRTPLNIILGFSETMYLSPEVYGDLRWPPELREDIYQIYSSSRHLLEMINDVLDLSRIEMVGFTLNKQPTQLKPLVENAAEVVADLFRAHTTRLTLEVEADLPSLDLDRTRIRQVLLNLLHNATRFTEEGEVHISARRVNREVWVSVRDNGAGIPPDNLPNLFKEFYQADRSLSRKYGGAGLGLAISKHFIDAHDGRIWVESEVGVGSTFTFALPIPEYHVPRSRLQRMTPGLFEHSPPSHLPVLVVDQDPEVANFLQRHLEDREVIRVGEPEDLETEIKLQHPHAVIYNVPPGGRVLPMPADLPASVPWIQCSIPSHSWLVDDQVVKGCLSKPITAEQLLEIIEPMDGVRDILVIDDDWGFCQLVLRMLQAADAGYEVRRADDGEAGLQALREQPPDLLLLDLVMPDMDGFHILDAVRANPELGGFPVILLTATSYVEDALRQLSSQMILNRARGFSPGEVAQCLRGVLNALDPEYDEDLIASASEMIKSDLARPLPPV